MNKILNNDDAHYTLAWSQLFKYDKYTAMKILPELSGIVNIFKKNKNGKNYENQLFYGCWRDGCRIGFSKLLDPLFTPQSEILNAMGSDDIYYKYTVVDTSQKDMKDIMFWLMQSYKTKFNNPKAFTDSKRYRNISVDEKLLDKDSVVERLPRRKY